MVLVAQVVRWMSECGTVHFTGLYDCIIVLFHYCIISLLYYFIGRRSVALFHFVLASFNDVRGCRVERSIVLVRCTSGYCMLPWLRAYRCQDLGVLWRELERLKTNAAPKGGMARWRAAATGGLGGGGTL
jgi:hypothetical protein